MDYKRIERLVFDKLVEKFENKKFPVSVSPRIIGDAMQEWVSDILDDFYEGDRTKFTPSKLLSRRAFEDCIILDGNEYHSIDIKTHCKSSTRSAPNLVSIKRLYKFIRGHPFNHFDILIVDYGLSGDHIHVDDVKFMPIEQISWESLNIVNIGSGQLQLKDANCIIRKNDPDWYKKFMINVEKFYKNQYGSIGKNMKYFGL